MTYAVGSITVGYPVAASLLFDDIADLELDFRVSITAS